MRYYGTNHHQQRQQFPEGFAPEDNLPADIRRVERLRRREITNWCVDQWINSGVNVDVVTKHLVGKPGPDNETGQSWALRLEQARLIADHTVCSMPVRGCRDHGDTLVWHDGGWDCRVPDCPRGRFVTDQRQHCPFPRVAVIDYPSGHRRRVCAGHLASERARWANAPQDATIHVTEPPAED